LNGELAKHDAFRPALAYTFKCLLKNSVGTEVKRFRWFHAKPQSRKGAKHLVICKSIILGVRLRRMASWRATLTPTSPHPL